MDDIFNRCRFKVKILQDLPGQLRTLFRMADLALVFLFIGPADIVQQGRRTQDIEPGSHQPTDMQGGPVDAAGMVRPVAAPFTIAVLTRDPAQFIG
jgi:hypothetical protein